MGFDEIVIIQLLADRDFNFKEIKELKSVNSFFYNFEFYKYLEELIVKGNVEFMKQLTLEQQDNREFLEVMTFQNENSDYFIVTVYDNLLLEQNPEIIKIYPLK